VNIHLFSILINTNHNFVYYFQFSFINLTMHKSVFLITVIISSFCGINGVTVTNCGQTAVTVRLPVCDQLPPGTTCTLQIGSTHEMEVDFVPPVSATTVQADVTATLGPLNVPWPGFNRAACRGNLQCPLRGGQSTTYRLKFEVKPFYPPISTVATYKLTEKPQNRNIFCFQLPLQLIRQQQRRG